MSFDDIKTALDDLKALGTHSLVFAGGEPYLRKDFPEILEYAASLDFILAVVTNGSYITREVLARFPKENCRLTLSIDGIKAHNVIRGGQSTFELMEEKLGLMKEMGVPHSVSNRLRRQRVLKRRPSVENKAYAFGIEPCLLNHHSRRFRPRATLSGSIAKWPKL